MISFFTLHNTICFILYKIQYVNIDHFIQMLFSLSWLDVQAQQALKRKWAQRRFAWGKISWGEPPIASNLFNYHTNSSITETSRATISLEQPHARPSEQNNHFTSKAHQKANGGEKRSNSCSNGEVAMLTKRETSDIWLHKAQRGCRGTEAAGVCSYGQCIYVHSIWRALKKHVALSLSLSLSLLKQHLHFKIHFML